MLGAAAVGRFLKQLHGHHRTTCRGSHLWQQDQKNSRGSPLPQAVLPREAALAIEAQPGAGSWVAGRAAAKLGWRATAGLSAVLRRAHGLAPLDQVRSAPAAPRTSAGATTEPAPVGPLGDVPGLTLWQLTPSWHAGDGLATGPLLQSEAPLRDRRARVAHLPAAAGLTCKFRPNRMHRHVGCRLAALAHPNAFAAAQTGLYKHLACQSACIFGGLTIALQASCAAIKHPFQRCVNDFPTYDQDTRTANQSG